MALVPEQTISDIRARADIVAVIGRHVKLRKAGTSHKGLCPFHNEKSPSFNVNPAKGFYYCFGCQKKGDVFAFLMEYEGKSFIEAAKQLAEEVGVTIEMTEAMNSQGRSEKADLLHINRVAAEYFAAQLRGPRGTAAQQYLRDRGISPEIADEFALGYALDDWRNLSDHLGHHQININSAEHLGLVLKQPKAGGVYDRFRHRLVCPVAMPGGDVVGFSARILPGATTEKEDTGKYINSPESLLYKKSRLLFGLKQAIKGFRAKERAILVEGNFDVIALHQAGLTETVAPLGTALTEEQVTLLSRHVSKVVLLFDGDAAGRAATLKSLKLLVSQDLDVYVARLPEGQDPDSLVRQNPDKLRELIDRAQAAVEYFIFEEWSKNDGSAAARTRVLTEAAGVLRTVKNATKRDLLLGTMATALSTDVPTLRQGLRRALLEEKNPVKKLETSVFAPSPAMNKPQPVPPSQEMDILAILADHPDLIPVAEEYNAFSLLTDPQLRDMYAASLSGKPLWETADPSLNPAIAKHVFQGTYTKSPDPGETLRGMLQEIRRRQSQVALRQLQKQAESAKRQGDFELERSLVRQIVATRKQVEDPWQKPQ